MMKDEYWFSRLESVIFDLIKKKSMPYLKKYSDINFVSEPMSETPAKFPCVEITELPGIERGRTFDETTVNGILETIQVNVYSEKSKSIANDVMSEIVYQMKQAPLSFEVTAMPTHAKNGNIHRYSARFRRLVMGGDTLAK